MTDVAALAAGAGSGMVAGSVLWYLGLRRRMRRDIEAVLDAEDPAARIAAVEVVASHGIAAVARSLLHRVEVESDDGVLDAIAAAVARSQWEPLTSPELMALRLWAAQRRQQPRPGPEAPGPHGGRPPAAVPGLSGAGPAAHPPQPADRISAWQPPPRFSADDHVGGKRPIVVIDAGTAAGAAVVGALQRSGHRVVALVLDDGPAGPASASVTWPDGPARVWWTTLPSADQRRPGVWSDGGPLVELAHRIDAAAVLTPTAAAVDVVVPVRYTLVGLGVAVTVPMGPLGLRHPGRGARGPLGPLAGADLDRSGLGLRRGAPVRGFLAEVVVDGGEVVGRVVLEPLGPGSGPSGEADAGGVAWPTGRDRTVRARAVASAPVDAALAEAVRGAGACGPYHVRGGSIDGGDAWVAAVEVGFSPALALALATGADLVGAWVDTALGRRAAASRPRYDDGLVVVHHGSLGQVVGPAGRAPWAGAGTAPLTYRAPTA